MVEEPGRGEERLRLRMRLEVFLLSPDAETIIFWIPGW